MRTTRKRTKEEEAATTPATMDKPLLRDEPSAKRWKNWWTRGLFTAVMLAAFCTVIWLGHVALTIMVILLQLKCFQEIISIGGAKYRNLQLPWWRTLNWYFLGAANYYFYGVGFGHYMQQYFVDQETAQWLVRYHNFISFNLYVIGFCGFVLSLKHGHYQFQFTQFGWTHLALALIVMQSHFIIQNMYAGLVWFLLPASLVVCNDIMAYMCGFFFGKTRLISLSPKKTWEGFIGAFFSTLFFAVGLAIFLGQYDYFVCPVDKFSLFHSDGLTCKRNPVFEWTEMETPLWLQMLGLTDKTIPLFPLAVHAVIMSIFASLIAPFGGFFASGLKRAFKIKDFDDLIPGHGGITDRFDCQLGMASFAHVYFTSFIKIPDVSSIMFSILALDVASQRLVLQKLMDAVTARELP